MADAMNKTTRVRNYSSVDNIQLYSEFRELSTIKTWAYRFVITRIFFTVYRVLPAL